MARRGRHRRRGISRVAPMATSTGAVALASVAVAGAMSLPNPQDRGSALRVTPGDPADPATITVVPGSQVRSASAAPRTERINGEQAPALGDGRSVAGSSGSSAVGGGGGAGGGNASTGGSAGGQAGSAGSGSSSSSGPGPQPSSQPTSDPSSSPPPSDDPSSTDDPDDPGPDLPLPDLPSLPTPTVSPGLP